MRRQNRSQSPARTLPLLLAALAALLLPLTLSGTAVASNGSGPASWTVQVGAESHNQAMQGMAFLPSNVFINAGDTVNWAANSAEIHTVTFLGPGQTLDSLQPFDPSNPLELFPTPQTVFDGMYTNSGVITNVSNSGFPSVTTYALTFPMTGDFTYYCLVHGVAMKGVVHVREAGTAYPFTQAQYDKQAKAAERATVRDGNTLRAATLRLANQHTVFTGADNGSVMVMRFVRPTVTVHVGETVTFTNNGMGAPHTVTFGTEPPNVLSPVGDPTAFSGGDLNSGLMVPGSTFAVTFTKAGSFTYICGLHDYMGMVGTVNVR